MLQKDTIKFYQGQLNKPPSLKGMLEDLKLLLELRIFCEYPKTQIQPPPLLHWTNALLYYEHIIHQWCPRSRDQAMKSLDKLNVIYSVHVSDTELDYTIKVHELKTVSLKDFKESIGILQVNHTDSTSSSTIEIDEPNLKSVVLPLFSSIDLIDALPQVVSSAFNLLDSEPSVLHMTLIFKKIGQIDNVLFFLVDPQNSGPLCLISVDINYTILTDMTVESIFTDLINPALEKFENSKDLTTYVTGNQIPVGRSVKLFDSEKSTRSHTSSLNRPEYDPETATSMGDKGSERWHHRRDSQLSVTSGNHRLEDAILEDDILHAEASPRIEALVESRNPNDQFQPENLY